MKILNLNLHYIITKQFGLTKSRKNELPLKLHLGGTG